MQISKTDRAGLASIAIGLFGGAALTINPWELDVWVKHVLFWLCILLTMFGIQWLLDLHLLGNRTRLLRSIFHSAIIFMLSVCIISVEAPNLYKGWKTYTAQKNSADATLGSVAQSTVKDDSIPVFPAFAKAAKETNPLIGEPIAPAEESPGVYQVWLEQGNVFWLPNPGIMCGAGNGAHDGKSVCTNDVLHATTTEPNLYNEVYVKTRLKLTRTDHWPRGSLAYAMIYHHDEWGWLGKTYIQCRLDHHQVHFQKFTNGAIYGPFRATPRNDLEAAFFYVILTDERSFKVSSNITPPTNIGCDGD